MHLWWGAALAVFLAMAVVEAGEVEPLAVAELGHGRKGAVAKKASVKKKVDELVMTKELKADLNAEKVVEKTAQKKREKKAKQQAKKPSTFASKVAKEVKKEKKAAIQAAKPPAAMKVNVDPGPTKVSITEVALPSPMKKEDDVNRPRKTDSIKVLKAKADRKIKEIEKLEKTKDQLKKQIKGKGDKIGKAPKGDQKATVALPKVDSKKIAKKLSAGKKSKKHSKKIAKKLSAGKQSKKDSKKIAKKLNAGKKSKKDSKNIAKKLSAGKKSKKSKNNQKREKGQQKP